MQHIYNEIVIPEKFKIDKLHQNTFLLDGELVPWTGDCSPVISAVCFKNTNGELERSLLGSVPNMGEKEALKALDAAVRSYDNGQGKWPSMRLSERIKCVEHFLEKLRPTREEVSKLMMWEIGKSYEDSCIEFDRTIEYIEDTIKAVYKLDANQSKIISHGGIDAKVKRSSLGVVLCMAPYNYPLNESFCLLIPALICGNTTIFKPAKYGVLLLSPILKAFQESFPKGVVNVIYGSGHALAPPIMKSGKVDVLALIGNSSSANALQGLHPKQNRLRLVLGLEAKNPAIVLKDAAIETAVKECVLGSLAFNGQRCTALKILFVHRELIQEFNQKFVKEVEKLNCGMPWEKGVQITPLPELGKSEYMKELIQDAVALSAEVINPNGGDSCGNFVYPAVLYPVNEKMKVYHEEQFGPVVPIVPFDSIDEPLKYITNSRYGQQVSLFSENANSLKPLVNILVNQVSRVNINTKCQRGPDVFPFVGRKDSAVSTLSVKDALKSFSIRTMVALRSGHENSGILNEVFE